MVILYPTGVFDSLSARGLLAAFLSIPGLACSVDSGVDAPVAARSVAPIEWQSYGATPGGTHFSPAGQVTPANVADLEVAWIHRSGDFRERAGGEMGADDWGPQTSLQVTPIVVEGTLYYCTPFNRVFALDAETGEQRWVFDPELGKGVQVLPNCRGVSSWRSGAEGFCEHRIFTGTLDARLIALDATTGKRCPDFGKAGEVDTTHRITAHDPVEYGITSPPAILGDLVITGAMVLDNIRTDAPAGVVRAYDVRSGELRWAWNPVPPGREPVDAEGNYVSGTTNVWSIIAVDPERNLVFVPTGNTNPDFYGGHRDGLDFYSSSVVALDGDTGEVVWHYQFVHHDIWDYDTPAQPTLIDLDINGNSVPALVQVTKMGLTFVLHRETGEPLWPVEERPAPQSGAVEGEYLAPTQPWPTHLPQLVDQPLGPEDAWGLTFWDRGACRDRIKALKNDGLYTPPTVEGSIHYPWSGGGNNWGSPAIDPRSGIMVVYTTRVPAIIKLTPQDQCQGFFQRQAGTPYCIDTDMVASPLGMPCTEPPWGTLDAIDLAAGKILWRVPLGTTRDLAPFPIWWIRGLPGLGAPMVTAGGLVFSGISNEHAFRAFDLATGEELWKARLPTAANAVPMTYVAGGRQFIVVAAGGHWSGGSPPADYIMAFSLPMGD
jgi:quinoprotein glucose dehydrogenase